MKRPFAAIFLVVFLALSLFQPAQAQMGGPGMGSGLNNAMMKIFGKTTAFSAKAEVKIAGAQSMTMPAEIAVLDWKMRMSVDLSAMKGDQFPPQMAAQLKQMGMDTIVTIAGPSQKSMVTIYPGLYPWMELRRSPVHNNCSRKESHSTSRASGLNHTLESSRSPWRRWRTRWNCRNSPTP